MAVAGRIRIATQVIACFPDGSVWVLKIILWHSGGQSAPLMGQHIIVEARSGTRSVVSLRDARNVSKQTVRAAHVTHS